MRESYSQIKHKTVYELFGCSNIFSVYDYNESWHLNDVSNPFIEMLKSVSTTIKDDEDIVIKARDDVVTVHRETSISALANKEDEFKWWFVLIFVVIVVNVTFFGILSYRLVAPLILKSGKKFNSN